MKDLIESAVNTVHQFIADELEVREASMMPPSDGDAAYIKSAKDALEAATLLKAYVTRCAEAK